MDNEKKMDDLALSLVRVTEFAALASAKLHGRGDKNMVDKAAVDAMREHLDKLDIDGTVIIGEGEKDDAPMLYIGENLGLKKPESTKVDIAVDPVDGTRLVADGLPNAIAVIATAEKGSMASIPCYYAKKMAYGEKLKGFLDIKMGIAENLKIAAARLDKDISELTVAVLDKPRHREDIKLMRDCGARIKLIPEGDIAASIACCMDEGKVDICYGIGGGPEAVITAAAIRALGGDMQLMLHPISDAEREFIKTSEFSLDKVYFAQDLVKGKEITFACTGITDGELLPGVTFKNKKAVTHSIAMRVKTGTVRKIEAIHNLKCKSVN